MVPQEHFEDGHALTKEEVAQIEARKQAAIVAAMSTLGTITRHLRLSIDFHITIAGTPPDDDGMNEPDSVFHAQQARLLASVKNNPSVLKQWMLSLIACQMQQKDWPFWDTLTGGEVALQDILAPALAVLPEDDQEYFAEMTKGLYFDDLINLFSASFSVKEDAPVIQEEETDRQTRSVSKEGVENGYEPTSTSDNCKK